MYAFQNPNTGHLSTVSDAQHTVPVRLEEGTQASPIDPSELPPNMPQQSGISQALKRLTAPAAENCNDFSNFARLVWHYWTELVIALPDSGDPSSPSDLYAIDGRGMLSREQGAALLIATGEIYLVEAMRAGKQALAECLVDVLRLKDARALDRMRAIAAAAVTHLRGIDALPEGLVVCRMSEIDADLLHVGSPSGVLSLLEGRILPPAEARKHLISCDTGVQYNVDAHHPKVDEILPPLSLMQMESMELYRSRVLGWTLCHEPRREFVWEVCQAGSGKSSFQNALVQGLGNDYIQVMRPEALRKPTRNHGTTGTTAI